MKIPQFEAKDREKLQKTVFFIGVLLVSGILLNFLDSVLVNPGFMNNWLAASTTYILNILGDFSYNGRFIYGSNIYEITRDCLGWKSVYAFLSLSIASWKVKKPSVRFLTAGTITILSLNSLRILTTIILAESGVISFEVIHNILWRWSLTFATFAIWLIWLKIDYKNL